MCAFVTVNKIKVADFQPSSSTNVKRSDCGSSAHLQLINFYIFLKNKDEFAATSKMKRFVISVNGCQPLTIITKRFILDVAAVLDPPLKNVHFSEKFF